MPTKAGPTIRERVIKAIREHGPLRMSQIRERTGIQQWRSLTFAIRKLLRSGDLCLLKCDGKRFFRIAVNEWEKLPEPPF